MWPGGRRTPGDVVGLSEQRSEHPNDAQEDDDPDEDDRDQKEDQEQSNRCDTVALRPPVAVVGLFGPIAESLSASFNRSSRGSAFRGRLACHLILADRQSGQNVASAVTVRTFRICRWDAIQGCVDALQICIIAPAKAGREF